MDIFPNTHFVKRRPQFEMRHIIEFSKNRDFTDIMVINEDRKEPSKIGCVSRDLQRGHGILFCFMN